MPPSPHAPPPEDKPEIAPHRRKIESHEDPRRVISEPTMARKAAKVKKNKKK